MRCRGRRLLAVPLTVLFVFLAADPARVQTVAAPSATRMAHDDHRPLPQELEVARLINEFRSLSGLPALEFDERLGRAAREHARRMALEKRLEHVLDGIGPGERAAAEGFRGRTFENVAGGAQASPRAIVELWIGSPPHRANLLAVATGIIGVGFARSAGGEEVYYSAMFAATP